MTLRYGILFLLGNCLLVLGNAVPIAGARSALVIGNSKYESSVGALRNAVNDAKAMTKTLRSLGFTVIEEHNVTRDELIEAVGEFRKKLTHTEVAIFYYAGHGISVGGSNYLVPIKSNYPSTTGDDSTLRLLAETKLFNAEQIGAEMSAGGGICNIVILDACRNTPIARDSRTRDLGSPGGLSEMRPPTGSLVAFATDAGRTAQDGTGENGLYTEELLKNLRSPGLSIEQVFKRTRAGVMQRSEGSQIPAEYSRLVGDDVYLAGPAPASALPSSAVVTPKSPVKAEPVVPYSAVEISKLIAAGKVKESVAALNLTSSISGAGDYALSPIETLLEMVKEDLKDLTQASPQVENALVTCNILLEAIPLCLPETHPQAVIFTAKAQNRRGDSLLLLGRYEEALSAYNAAIQLVPTDAYPIFNRGRAQLALGHRDSAIGDFTTASGESFKQPKARKLALQALENLSR